MPETFETFVEKLREDGVEAGKAEAAALLAQARKDAESVVSEARSEAEGIVSAARAEAERIAEAQRNELRLAARDALLRLRDGIAATVLSVVRQGVGAELKDDGLLKKLIIDIVVQYAKADAAREQTITFDINKDVYDRVGTWALRSTGGTSVDFQGSLKALGFEYSAGDSTVEVTVDSVVEVLKDHVSARLHELLASAVPS